MTLDPQARAYLEQQVAAGVPALSTLSPAQARAQTERLAPLVGGPSETVDHVSTVPIDGGLNVRVYQPSSSGGALVYYHGGGWVVGSLEVYDALCRRLANRSQVTVVSVDYRLAPEHRFPAAVDDARAALRWAADHSASDDGRLIVAGDSAGGNLAAVAARHARDAGGPQVALQVLVYPVIDHRFDTGSYREHSDGYGLTQASMRWYWDHYLGPDGDGSDPDASPLRAGDLSGLPPALVLLAQYDPLFDEGQAYAQRLRDAGVAVTCTSYDGQIHGFFRMAGVFDAAERALEEVAAAVRDALAQRSVG